ncbi:MAG TPA: TlpA disulfide reductase family protein [Planctomycetaceae bacterium]|nr:TlpA disulfide reductase family protein [Planctomycetaceae bacterium]
MARSVFSRANRSRLWIVLWLTAAVNARGAAATNAAPPSAASPSAVLYLNSGFVRGELRDSDKPEVLCWQGTDFVTPFLFDTRQIDAVYFPDPIKPERPVGQYCFELSGGDVVFGSLVSLTDQEAELDVPLLGRLRVPRNQLQRMTRKLDDGGMVYRGPNGFADWKLSPSGAWKNDQGQLWTDQNDASAQSTLSLPPRSAIEIVLSWSAKPNFAMALGMGYRIEAWQRELVLVGESEHQADLASLQPLDYEAGRIHLFLFLDQQTGECIVYSSKGAPLANMKLTDSRKAQTSFRLSNNRGDIHLERLRIDHWNRGRPLAGETLDKPRICLADGSIKYGEIDRFESGSKTFQVRGTKDSPIPADRVVDIFLGKTDQAPRAFTVDYQDSSRFSGQLLKIENGKIWLASPTVRDPLRLPLAGLRSLIVHQPGPAGKKVEGVGTLEIEGARLAGTLSEGHETAGSSCLCWQPRGSATASALKPSVSGRIVFREMAAHGTPEKRKNRRNRAEQNGAPVEASNAEESQGHQALTKALFLRTGDMVPCEITRIDEKGVTYKTPLADLGTIANDKIKAVVLTLDGRGPVELTKEKRDRLLTLPRMQRDNPPTHLIRSCDGDYLRGRVVEMDDRKLMVEVRLQTKEVPRDRISRIIWLHPDELPGAAAAKKKTDAAPQSRVQAVHDNGTRLTFHPQQFKDSILSGTSDALGPCRISLESIDQLLIGNAIEEAVVKTAYQQWKLRYALEPKFVTADANAPKSSGSAGLESSLVGKAAPDFELDMLNGDHFRLSDHKGKTVVLDFWATWCGPCLQTIPHVAQLHRDSAATGVKVVAVNLEETPEQIQALLKRLKLEIPVALDRDGAIAARYGVSAIPQTLIIDREGKVVRHFVGGSTHFAKDLNDALHGATTAPPAKSPSPSGDAHATPAK